MEILVFVLGVLVGMVLSILGILTIVVFRTQIERTVRQIESSTKTRGKIIDDSQNEDFENYLKTIEKTDAS